MKKTTLVLVITALIVVSCREKKEAATISGTVVGSGVATLLITNNFNDVPDTIAVNSGGFSTSVKSGYPGFRYLMIGKSVKDFFSAPGYALKIIIRPTDIADSCSFKIEGDGASENYIHDSVSNLRNAIDAGSIFGLAPEKALACIDSSYRYIDHYFDKLISASELDPAYIKAERINLAFDAAAIKVFFGRRNNIRDTTYYSFTKKLDLWNDEYMGFPAYIDFWDAYLNLQAAQSSRENASDQEFLDVLLAAIQKIKNRDAREYFLFNKISLFLGSDLVPDPGKYRSYFTKHNTNPVYERKIEALFSGKRLLAAGEKAPEFMLPDLAGHNVSLKDFAGKYVYIDFWATWCHPCLEELPYYEQLQSDYKNKNIVFLSISLDNDKGKWQRFSTEHAFKEGNLWAEEGVGSSVAKAYGVAGIPKFVLIDKDGKLIEQNAAWPSSKEIRKTLESLPGLIH